MATQLFEGREHAAVYQKYRFAPGEELKQTILTYLQEKVRGVWSGCRGEKGKSEQEFSWAVVFTLLGVLPWLVPWGRINQEGSR